MLAATLKGTYILGMAAGHLSLAVPEPVEHVSPAKMEEPPLQLLLEVEIYEGDDIIVRWI